MQVDPRTPVVVGVGQFTERIGTPDYRGMSSVDLATEAVRAALAALGLWVFPGVGELIAPQDVTVSG